MNSLNPVQKIGSQFTDFPGKDRDKRRVIEGVRHTRGTPPAVIETDAATWIALATGGLGWADAVESGRVRASGERTDLSPYLPLG